MSDKPVVSLRPAAITDAQMLLTWRNDPETCRGSRSHRAITWEEHIYWLKDTFLKPHRQLYVAEQDGVPVGTIRCDLDRGGQSWELSWTVAPAARRHGVGTAMVSLLADMIELPVRAEIRPDNLASRRIAEKIGMIHCEEKDGLLHYWRGAR